MSQPTRRAVSAENLARVAQLDNIRFTRISARQLVVDDADSVDAEEVSPDLEVAFGQQADLLVIELKFVLKTLRLECVLDLEMTYLTATDATLDDTTVTDFVERSAIFTAVPFFRATVVDLCGRLGIRPVMIPLIKPAAAVPFS